MSESRRNSYFDGRHSGGRRRKRIVKGWEAGALSHGGTGGIDSHRQDRRRPRRSHPLNSLGHTPARPNSEPPCKWLPEGDSILLGIAARLERSNSSRIFHRSSRQGNRAIVLFCSVCAVSCGSKRDGTLRTALCRVASVTLTCDGCAVPFGASFGGWL